MKILFDLKPPKTELKIYSSIREVPPGTLLTNILTAQRLADGGIIPVDAHVYVATRTIGQPDTTLSEELLNLKTSTRCIGCWPMAEVEGGITITGAKVK